MGADPFLAYPRLAPPPQSVFDDSFKVASGWDRAQFAHREAQNVMDQAFAEVSDLLSVVRLWYFLTLVPAVVSRPALGLTRMFVFFFVAWRKSKGF